MMVIDEKICLQKSFEFYKDEYFEQAEIWCQKALAAGVRYTAEEYALLGRILQARLDYVGALEAMEKAIVLVRNIQVADGFMVGLFTNAAQLSRTLGYIEKAADYYRRAAELADTADTKLGYYGSALLSELCGNISPEEVSARLTEMNTLIAADNGVKLDTARKYGDEKIHIAYISPDFRQHVMFNFYLAMFRYYDRNRFHVTVVYLNEKQDGYTEYIKSLVDEWLDASGMPVDKLTDVLRVKGFDIVVDLAGHSTGSGIGILARRVAPVQISGLGWLESTGIDAVDYLITDKYVDGSGSYITEKPLFLSSMFCYSGRSDVSFCNGAPYKRTGHITFGVFNSYHKVTDEMLNAWQKIMDQVPGSILLHKCQILVSESAKELVRKRFMKFGFDMDRVLLEPATTDYMERYLDVDIALDTYPYTGGGTTCDALYMGVPVVSLYGRRRGSRFGLSILSSCGLGELTTDSLDVYIAKAVALAQDTDLLDMVHKNLRNMMKSSPLMDGKKYMSELEEKYIGLGKQFTIDS